MLTPNSVGRYSNVRTAECCVPTLAVSFLFNIINHYYWYDVIFGKTIILYIFAYMSWTLSFRTAVVSGSRFHSNISIISLT